MALSDPMFIFDVCVKELKSYTACKHFYIRSQFADVFTFLLKDPNENRHVAIFRSSKKKGKRKSLMGYGKTEDYKSKALVKEDYIGQSVLLASNLDVLVSKMKKYPMELSIWSKLNSARSGSTHIPWSSVFFQYLNGLEKKCPSPAAVVEAKYYVFDEITSRRMATIKLLIKLTHLGNKVTTPMKCPPMPENSFGVELELDQQLETDKPMNFDVSRDIGTIKTIYGGGTQRLKLMSSKKNNSNKFSKDSDVVSNEIKNDLTVTNIPIEEFKNFKENDGVNTSIASLIRRRSDTDIDSNKQIAIRKSRSYSAMELKQRLHTLNYIFGDPNGVFGNKVYCVGYFTVENDNTPESPRSKPSSKVSIKVQSDALATSDSSAQFTFRTCGSECLLQRNITGPCMHKICSIELPKEAAHMINIRKCTKVVECDHLNRDIPVSPDKPIILDLTSLSKKCCQITKVEEIMGGVEGVVSVERQPCFCSCACRFGFTKKTTYCAVCGGYEIIGDEMAETSGLPPFPCPIYHNIVDKNAKLGKAKTSTEKRGGSDKKSVESEKDSKKGKKKKKDDRFKFNYGYKAPQIGHSQCAMPCTGTLGLVPKHMGWLWTAENVPGLKYRPNWRPGAANKHVVRLLKIARNPEQVRAKRRKRDSGKKKRPLKRPLLVVHKKDGEFTVTMETMRMFSKPRAINQHPYEDKDALTFTVGRTEEENRERQRRKERAQRRLEREQRRFIESAFKDMCTEICYKTYQQALEILPGAEDPECRCYPAEPGPDKTDLEHSCSCSDQSKSSIGSDTDDDEWIVEFTPPTAYFDPSYKGKKLVKVDAPTQYTYMDYKVKLLDRYGNPVPRYFTGPDGMQECSDLGGFWGHDKTWLEINVDGYVGPDGRWAPNNFIGPGGDLVDAEAGKFQIANGQWLVVGVDGYVDSQNKWRPYPKQKETGAKRKYYKRTPNGTVGGHQNESKEVKPSEATWSCFGDATPIQLSQMGIVGHGHDRKLLLATLEKMMAQGEDVKMPQLSTVPHLPTSKRGRKYRKGPDGYDTRDYYTERHKCRHPRPPVKGIVTDERGHKTYFRITNDKNRRPKERVNTLGEQGISLSSFHVPCFSSFINSEVMKQQQYDRAMRYANKEGMKDAQIGIYVSPYLNIPNKILFGKKGEGGVNEGWRPGAISKRLLRMLNKAKQNRSFVEQQKPLRRSKKRIDDKPTLIIAKKDGEYHVEMQVDDEQYKPLKYTIASANNQEKIERRERRKERLVRESFKKAFREAPDVCQKTCLKSYKQAMGLVPYDPNNPECTCSDEELSAEESYSDYEYDTDDSSLDLDWEIHFSPPIACSL